MKVLDWYIMKNGANELLNKKIVIYGTSSSGKRIWDYLNFLGLQKDIIYACDTNEKKWGLLWNNLKIISPIEVCELSSDNVLIIVASAYIMEIYNYLSEIGYVYNLVSAKAYMHAFHYDLMNKDVKYFSEEIVNKYKNTYEIWFKINVEYIDLHKRIKSYEFIRLLLKNEVTILVHSIQKTGNQTLEASLSKYFNTTMSIHSLCSTEKEKSFLLKSINNLDKKVKILSGVRYPIERIISQKWQNYQRVWEYNNSSLSNIISKNSVDGVASKDIFDTVRWFKEQIENLFGIDVFQYPFDTNKGYSIINKGNISIFLYRLDYLDTLEKEIGDFIEYKDFKLINDNKAYDKSYALAYKEYLKDVKIDSVFFKNLLSSKEMLHFFSKSERDNYAKKWMSNLI